jgi:hypothetical protein
MAFRDFTYPKVIEELGLTEETVPDLSGTVSPIAPGEPVRVALPSGLQLGPAAHSEVARMIWSWLSPPRKPTPGHQNS